MNRPDTEISGWAYSQGGEVSARVNGLLDWIACLEADNAALQEKIEQHIADRTCAAKVSAEMREIIISIRAELQTATRAQIHELVDQLYAR